ncbi:hypothetical protein L1887_56475 [Cichorium endivia]|nr:hypothetical protein L1887_56475 [Cichorium endivia]
MREPCGAAGRRQPIRAHTIHANRALPMRVCFSGATRISAFCASDSKAQSPLDSRPEIRRPSRPSALGPRWMAAIPPHVPHLSYSMIRWRRLILTPDIKSSPTFELERATARPVGAKRQEIVMPKAQGQPCFGRLHPETHSFRVG